MIKYICDIMKKKIVYIIIILLFLAMAIFLVVKRNNKDFLSGELIIKNENNQSIYAVLHRPDVKGKMPIVIYSHGLGASYRACGDYADSLEELGIATLCFDFRGGSDNSKSDGSPKEMSFLTEMEDLRTIIEEVKKWDFIDLDNIILMGSSQGGAISALISAEREDIKGTVLLYPALGIPEVVTKWYSSKEAIPEEIKMTSKITVGPKYFIDIWDLDVYSIIEKDEKQILILQGTEDTLVKPDQSRKVNETYKNSELYFIEGAGHGFEDEQFTEAFKYIKEYLEEINVIR